MPDSPKADPHAPKHARRLSMAVPDRVWNPLHINDVKCWLERILQTTVPSSEELLSGTPFEDGQLLFRIVRALAPDFRPNVRMVESQLPFLAGNNVDFFLSFLTELKVPEVCLHIPF